MTNREGRLAGCGVVQPSPNALNTALLRGLLIRRQWEDGGLGTRLYTNLLAFILTEKTFQHVAVEANQYSRGFFERIGFEPEHFEADGFGPGFDRVDLLLDLEIVRKHLPKE